MANDSGPNVDGIHGGGGGVDHIDVSRWPYSLAAGHVSSSLSLRRIWKGAQMLRVSIVEERDPKRHSPPRNDDFPHPRDHMSIKHNLTLVLVAKAMILLAISRLLDCIGMD